MAIKDSGTGRVAGKVIVITGGASGIGLACAKRLAAEGASLVLADLFVDQGEAAVEAIQGISSAKVQFVKTDVTSEEEQIALGQATIEEFGCVDGVVAAAGISNANYFEERDYESRAPDAGHVINKATSDWQKVLDVNLTGVMLTNKVMAKLMVESGTPGSIVNIASVAAKRPLVGAADYCVSKAGVAMLTQVLAAEMSQLNVRVNAIGPGFIETPMTQNIRADNEGNMMAMSMTPMGRYGLPVEIANTALFLLSDESSYFSGQTLFPAGGMYTG